jgi:hypothetical protein
MTPVVIVFLLCVSPQGSKLPGAGPEDSEHTIESLVSAHEATIDCLRSVDLVVDKRPVGKPRSVVRATESWVKQGNVEKYARRDELTPAGEGVPKSITTTVHLDWASMTMQFLRFPGDLDLSTVRPESQRGMIAVRAPFDRNLLEVQVYSYLLLRVALDATDERRTLRELIDEAESARLVGIARVGDADCYEIDVIHQGVVGKGKGEHIHLFLDPNAGLLLRKIAIHHERKHEKHQNAGADVIKTQSVTEILKFKDFGGGAYFPTESETYVLVDGKQRARNRFIATSLAVNAPIENSKLIFRFPENALVSVRGQPVTPLTSVYFPTYDLIGADGTAIKTFGDGRELERFLQSRGTVGKGESSAVPVPPAQAPGGLPVTTSKPTWRYLIGGGVLIVVIGIAGIWFHRRTTCTKR